MAFTLEQQKAIALAKARKRKSEHEAGLVNQAKQPQTIEDQILALPGMKPVAEMAAAANKSVFQFLDFIGPNNVNAVLDIAGSDKRMPTLTESFASNGGYMEEGTARDAVQAAGQLLPAAAAMTPVAGRNLASIKGATEEVLGLGSAKVIEPVKAATTAVTEALPSKAKEQAKLPLYRGSGDVATAGFKLEGDKVVKDKVQQKAIKAGIDKGTVAMISQSNKATKSRLKEMVEVLERGKENLEFRNFNPPQKVVGQAINDRLKIIQGANRQAADRLDEVANSLQGQSIDVSPAIKQLLKRLDGERIRFNPKTGALNFNGSSIEGEDLKKAQRIITRVVRRLHQTKDPSTDALRVHDAKKFIDEQVSFGKSQAGLSGRMEGIIKELRHNLDGILDQNFREYDQVNTMYSETRGVIDELQSLAGNKVDLTGDNVDKALGVMSRKVLSNYSSGTATEDLFKQLDDVATRYSTPLSGGTDDELLKIVSTEAELRKMFPTASKPNTFQGEIGTEAMRGAEMVKDAVKGDSTLNPIKAGMNAVKKVKEVFSNDEDAKLEALKELLSD